MHIIAAIIWIVVGISGCQSTGDASASASVSLEQAQAHFRAQQYDVAYGELLPLAAKGNAQAQYAVGYMYYYGKGVDQNDQLAQHWLRRAAKQGDLSAIKALAAMGKHSN